MGNDPNKYISLHIKDEHKQVLDEEKKETLYRIYQQFTQENGFLIKKDFNKLTKIEDTKNVEQLFDIFATRKDKMYYSELLYFYISFTNEKLKSVLLSFLLFGKSGKISHKNYMNNVTQFINVNHSFLILTEEKFLEQIKYIDKVYESYIPSWNTWNNLKNLKFIRDKEIYYDKNLFIAWSNNLILQKKLTFSFFRGYKTSSQLANIPIKDIKSKTYICDCLLEKKNKNLIEEDDLEEMRNHFNMKNSVINGRLLFTNFEKLMKEIRVNQKLIDIVIKFLKNYTMKDYLNFEDFKNLMSNIYHHVSISHKKRFLFKMILTIANAKSSIKTIELCKIMKIDNPEYKPSGTIDDKNFESLNDPIINAEIDTYIGYMENLGLLPYLKFGVKNESQDLKKKIVNFILNEKTAEEYLIENFDNCEFFYPINMEFWNSLIEKGKIPDIEINNSIIAEEDNIYYLNKKEEEKNKKDGKEQIDEKNGKSEKDGKDENEKNQTKNEVKKNSQEDNAQKQKQQDEKENQNTIHEIKKKKKIGKLLKDKKYGIDYVIICGTLYNNISKNFGIDYEIKLPKMAKIIPEKKEEKEKEQEEQKEQKEKQKSEEEKKSEEKKENQETMEIENEKLEINIEENYLRKKGNEKKGIKEYIVDFYPVNLIQLNIVNPIVYIENEKTKIENKKKEEEWEKKTKEEKNKIIKEKEKIAINQQNRADQYLQKLRQLHEIMNEGGMDKTLFDEKIKLLREQYKDILKNEDPKEKELTNLKKSEFFDLLKLNLKDYICSKINNIQKASRFFSVQDIKDILIKNNNSLKSSNFNLLFYTLKNQYFIPKDETTFIDNGIEDFTFIFVDISTKNGQNYLSALEKNENEKNIIKEKKEEDNNNKNNIKENFELLSKEEIKKIKENLNEKEKLKKQQEKLEKEQLEQMEKLEKEKEKEKEKMEKMKKAQEKYVNPPYGIPNFGNTCYFNSINQIFFNLPILQKLFMNPEIKYFINKENKFGYKGKFILAFISLYHLYPSRIDDYAYNLKQLVGKFKEVFNNREQQDANEYLNFVLEALHEELNLKSRKRYIEDKDDNYKYNTEEELGNIAWANNLRRNVSFIDSIFMFQLKSNLTCKRCGTKKVNYETNYVFDLPLSLCKIVTVNIHLFRLPFKYKIYFDKINKNFAEFIKLEENKNKNIMDNLFNYYTVKLTYEQKLEHVVHINFEFDFERQKSIGDMIKLLRNISILDLEPEDYDININNKEITEYKIKHFTDFLVYSYDKTKIIKNDTIIDKFVDINDNLRLNVYEILNTNGLNIIYKNNENNKNSISNPEFNLFSYKINRKGVVKVEDYEKKLQNTSYCNNKKNEKDENSGNANSNNRKTYSSETPVEKIKEQLNILSLNDKLSYYDEEIFCNDNNVKEKNTKKITEYIIPIVHFKRDLSKGLANIFLDFYYSSVKDFPQQFLVFNNSNYYQITPKYLYNYIWDYNSLYMNHPNKKKDKFWWNLDPNSKYNFRKCYPFLIRIVKQSKRYSFTFNCAKCQWYNFCFGCILYPDDDQYLEINSDCVIFVDWCNYLLKEEIESYNFNIKKFTNEEITQCIETQAKNDKSKQYQSIKDCFDFFFEKELLEDPLSCRHCGGPENFIKNYEINKLPYVLILSLKRFKYNENNNFKLKQLITYPINDFELKNKKYDLYGVVYHYGSINSGHYVCAIKHDNKWILCDDRSVYEIGEERVMNSNAYILFYISRENIYNNKYYCCMKSLIQHIVIDKNKKDYSFNDNNYFFGEPVITPYGEGYVMEDSIVDFKNEDNNDEKNKKEKDSGETVEKEKNEKTETTPQNNDEKNTINNINNNGLVKIKFDFGEGRVNKINIKKQILYDLEKYN